MYIVLLKLGLAAVAGLFLGLEREAKHKPLGLKTCSVIAIASCLLTIISIEAALASYNGGTFIRADPMRLAAQIVSGVGFLGAGVILRRSNDVISGLTTAAIVWAASGFGIAIGAGYYFEAGIGLLLIYGTVSFIPYIARKVGPHSLQEQEIHLNVFVGASENIKEIADIVGEYVLDVKSVKIKGSENQHRIQMRCIIKEGSESLFAHYDIFRNIPGVERVEIEGV